MNDREALEVRLKKYKKVLGLEFKDISKACKADRLSRQWRVPKITTSRGRLTDFDGSPQGRSKIFADPNP